MTAQWGPAGSGLQAVLESLLSRDAERLTRSSTDRSARGSSVRNAVDPISKLILALP
jgi:hypothetical protein